MIRALPILLDHASHLISVTRTTDWRSASGEVTPYDRHLRVGIGYLDRGLPLEANEELEQIEPEMRVLGEVLVVRLNIYQALAKYDLMEVVEGATSDPTGQTAVIHFAGVRHTRLDRFAGSIGRARSTASHFFNRCQYEGELRGTVFLRVLVLSHKGRMRVMGLAPARIVWIFTQNPSFERTYLRLGGTHRFGHVSQI